MVKNGSERSGAAAQRRKRVPKTIAVINVDFCTGCEACIAVCPVDCIALIETGTGIKGTEAWCEVDLDRCIGCAFCVRVPKKKSAPYELKICPWDAIEMVPPALLPQAITAIGGPHRYAEENRDRLLEAATRVAAERAAAAEA